MTLNELVSEYIVESSETENKRFKFLSIGISGIKNLNMDISGVPTIAILPINDNDTVNLPLDFIRYTRIGLIDSQGNVQEMGLNNNMALNRTADNCGNVIKNVPMVNSGSTFDPNYPFVNGGNGVVDWRVSGQNEALGDHVTNGENIGRFYGIGGGNNKYGYYKLDTQMGVIQLQNRSTTNISDHIFLEYLADAKMTNGEFEIHPFIVETIKAWIYWKSIQRNDKKGLGERDLAERTYWKEYNAANRRFNSKTLSEWMATFRKKNVFVDKW